MDMIEDLPGVGIEQSSETEAVAEPLLAENASGRQLLKELAIRIGRRLRLCRQLSP